MNGLSPVSGGLTHVTSAVDPLTLTKVTFSGASGRSSMQKKTILLEEFCVVLVSMLTEMLSFTYNAYLTILNNCYMHRLSKGMSVKYERKTGSI